MNLKRIDTRKIKLYSNDVIGFMIVKNESLRLPYVLDYYNNLGIERFFVIDNGSTDETIDILLSNEKIHVFSTTDKFQEHWSWMEYLLKTFGLNKWCLVADADELFVYPHHEIVKINNLCQFLDKEGSKAFHSILLDMYSNDFLKNVEYKRGQDPLSVAPWFDINTHHKIRSRYYSGMRERIFGITPCITKYPLVRIENGSFPSRGMHHTSIRPISSVRGVLLHFKYFQDFYNKVFNGVKNEQYWNNSLEYKAYYKILEYYPNINLWYPESVKLLKYKQLLEIGIMNTSANFEKYVLSFL